LIGVATLPMTNAEDALAEARRCVEQYGFRGVWRRPEHFAT
jgi:predicted TIM-barrel fold metal-dependent hydrolase